MDFEQAGDFGGGFAPGGDGLDDLDRRCDELNLDDVRRISVRARTG
jgi:hypothetical protein